MNRFLYIKLSFIEALEIANKDNNIIGIINADNPKIAIRIIDGKIEIDNECPIKVKDLLYDKWYIVY